DADDEILGTLAHLERLKRRRREILEDLNAVTSPVLSLPPELICEIFLHCYLPPSVLPTAKDAPLLLTQVCRRWRTIALSTPLLWSTVTVALLLSSTPTAGAQNMLEMWLERGANCPLSVSLIPDSGNDRSPNALFVQIRETSHRWRELHVARPIFDWAILFHRDTVWNLPELVKLSLLLPGGVRPPSGFSRNDVSNLTDLPSLREVYLGGFSPLTIRLPWSQLTTIHADNLYPSECLVTLAHSTQLVSGTFSLWSSVFHATVPDPFPPLSHLKSLSITGDRCVELLEHLTLSALPAFSICFEPGSDFGPLNRFLARASALTELSLRCPGAAALGPLISALEAHPALHAVSLSLDIGITNSIFLHVLKSTPGFLPNLRRLTITERIDRYNEMPLDDSVITGMLHARRTIGLTSFTLITNHVFRDIHWMFAALGREGLHITLRSHGSGPFLRVYFDSAKIN
ncbi:hypothetical protein C8J57DRAFT_1556377, partial [Mycena rebaudengoi]